MQTAFYLYLHLPDRALLCVEEGEQFAQKEAMMFPHIPGPRFNSLLMLMLDTPMRQASQTLRIAFPRTQRLHDSASRCSQDIAEDTGEFDPCLLQDLVDTVHQLRAILRAPWMRSRVTSRRSCWG